MSAQLKSTEDNNEQQNFSADVARLLDIVANALYTNQDVFLRELVSNSADACDRLRYDAIQNQGLTQDNPNFRICIYKDTTARTLCVVDNGVGMTDAEMAENLGTIAKSGTAALMENMHGAPDKLNLIGQFGVGFYAGYMVAHKIEVVSRKAGSDAIWCWTSDGRSGFTVKPATDIQEARLDGARGTAVMLYLKDSASEFLLDEKIKHTITEYSDHIGVPIYLGAPKLVSEDLEAQPLNTTSALWMRSLSELTSEQYEDFYRHISHGMDEPVMTCHWRAEGTIEFTGLLFAPTLRPWDLFDPSRKHFVKLYVRRVFISDEVETLMFPWLRFMRGIIDSEDLPLNISRESLQYNPHIEKIRGHVARKVLSDLDKLSANNSAAFSTFWGQFGPVLKEGLYDAPEHRPALFKVCRFYSTHDNGQSLVSLEDYKSRMIDGQDRIYYISGESLAALKNSPQIEGFRARGLEVLFMTDTIDDFWLQQAQDYKGTLFQSITKGDIDLSRFSSSQNDEQEKSDSGDQNAQDDNGVAELILQMQEILKDKVHNVRKSQRLQGSPVCLVAPEQGIDMHMERVLKIHQKYQGESKPVLELNAEHPLIRTIAVRMRQGQSIEDAAFMLLDQARIIQGEPLDDLAGFARRMSSYMQDALKG